MRVETQTKVDYSVIDKINNLIDKCHESKVITRIFLDPLEFKQFCDFKHITVQKGYKGICHRGVNIRLEP
jgi:hypothetical protein